MRVHLIARQKHFFFLLAFFILPKIIVGQRIEQKLISGVFNNLGIIALFDSLETHYDLRFYFEKEWLESKKTSLSFQNCLLSDAISQILSKTSYSYEIVQNRHVVLFPREYIALRTGSMLDYSDEIFESDIVTIGNPSQISPNSLITVKGKIIDGKSNETLLGATVWVKNTNVAVVSDKNGYYSLNLKPGVYIVQFSSVGFETSSYKLKILNSGTFNVQLYQESQKIEEVTVYAEELDKNIRNTRMSVVELDAKSIKQLPSINGEKDIVKSFTLLPGVQSTGEFGSGINVRGSSEDQNLYLINETPVFNTTHMFGLISVVNPDAVNKATLFKGHIPAKYGERASSVLEIQTQENNIPKFSTSGGIGLYTSRIMVKAPLLKNKASFSLGGRTGYPNWIIHQFHDYNLQKSSAFFYDLSANFNLNLNKNKIWVSAYTSFDIFNYVNEYIYNYGNNLLNGSWLHIFNTNLTSRLIIAYSNYNQSKTEKGFVQKEKLLKSSLNYTSVKYHIDYSGIDRHKIEAGIQLINYKIKPGSQSPLNSESYIKKEDLNQEQGYESSIYISDEFNLSEKLNFNLGLRFTYYTYMGDNSVNIYESGVPKTESSVTNTINYSKGEKIEDYTSLEPRLSLLYRTSENSSFKISYNHNKQFISLLSYTSVSTPDDIWKLSDNYVKPVSSHQFAFGYYRNLRNNSIETSIEFYYKSINNLPEYKNDATIEMNPHLETELLNATGRNYGVEVLLKKNYGTLEGWVSYTYSRAFKKTSSTYFDEIINNNNWFSSALDKPHNFAVVATYHFNKRLRFTGTFNYLTGRPVTLPEYQYNSGGQTLIYYSSRNKYRLPDYHRLDLAISIDENLKQSGKWKGSWTFSIINVYGRKNAHSVFYEKQAPGYYNNNKIYSLYKLYIIGSPLPTITYNFKF